MAVGAWTSRFCSLFGAWLAGIRTITTDASTKLQSARLPSARQQVLLDTYRRSARLTDTLSTGLEALGPPAIARGDRLKRDLLVRFRQFDAELSRLTQQVRGADTTDPATFTATVRSAAQAFQDNVAAIGDSFGAIDTTYPDPGFQSALRSSSAFLGP